MSQETLDSAEFRGRPGSWPPARAGKPHFSRRLYHTIGLAGAFLLTCLLLLALFPGQVAHYDPTEPVGPPFLAPSREHLLGTNDIGQDIFSELIWGTRASLLTGLTVGVLSVAIGTVAGLISGYFGNALSAVILIVVDLVLILPFLPLVILLSAYLGPSQRNVILVLVVVSWATPARLVHSRALAMTGIPYVEAARALGSSDARIIRRHVWPSVRTIALVQLVMLTASAILAEAGLSFLGLGNPSTKSWGTMLYFAQVSGVFLGEAWKWWVVPTGIMITLSVLSLVLLGYWLERQLEPNLR